MSTIQVDDIVDKIRSQIKRLEELHGVLTSDSTTGDLGAANIVEQLIYLYKSLCLKIQTATVSQFQAAQVLENSASFLTNSLKERCQQIGHHIQEETVISHCQFIVFGLIRAEVVASSTRNDKGDNRSSLLGRVVPIATTNPPDQVSSNLTQSTNGAEISAVVSRTSSSKARWNNIDHASIQHYQSHSSASNDVRNIFGIQMKRKPGGAQSAYGIRSVFECSFNDCHFAVRVCATEPECFRFQMDANGKYSNVHNHIVVYPYQRTSIPPDQELSSLRQAFAPFQIEEGSDAVTEIPALSGQRGLGCARDIVDDYIRRYRTATIEETTKHVIASLALDLLPEEQSNLSDAVTNRMRYLQRNDHDVAAPHLFMFHGLEQFRQCYSFPPLLRQQWMRIREARSADDVAGILHLACGDENQMTSPHRRFTIILDQTQRLEVIRTTETESPEHTERFMNAIVALISPSHIFSISQWFRTFPPGTRTIHVDGWHAIKGKACMVTFGTVSMRHKQYGGSRIVRSMVPFLHLISPTEKGITIQYGVRLIKWIIKSIYDRDLIIDFTVSDHNKAIRLGFSITDPQASNGLDYPHHFRAPKELWAQRISGNNKRIVLNGLQLLHHCRSREMLESVFRLLMSEWSAMNQVMETFTTFYETQYGPESEYKCNYNYGWSQNAIGPLPNNNALESYFSCIAGKTHINAGTTVPQDLSVASFLNRYCPELLKRDHHYHGSIRYGGGALNSVNFLNEPFGVPSPWVVGISLLMSFEIDVVESDIIGRYFVNAGSCIGQSITDERIETYRRIAQGQIPGAYSAAQAVYAVNDLCEITTNRSDWLTKTDIFETANGQQLYINMSTHRGESITMTRVYSYESTNDPAGLVEVTRDQIKRSGQLIVPENTRYGCTCKEYRENFVCPAGVFIMEHLGIFPGGRQDLIEKSYHGSGLGRTVFFSVFPLSSMNASHPLVAQFDYLHTFPVSGGIQKMYDYRGMEMSTERSNKAVLIREIIRGTALERELYGTRSSALENTRLRYEHRNNRRRRDEMKDEMPGNESPRIPEIRKNTRSVMNTQILRDIQQHNGVLRVQELNTRQGRSDRRTGQGCVLFSAYFAITHVLPTIRTWIDFPVDIEWHIDTGCSELFDEAETRGLDLTDMMDLDAGISIVHDHYDISRTPQLWPIMEQRIRQESSTSALLEQDISELVNAHQDSLCSLLFLSHGHAVSVLRLKRNNQVFFYMIDTAPLPGGTNGYVVCTSTVDALVHVLRLRSPYAGENARAQEYRGLLAFYSSYETLPMTTSRTNFTESPVTVTCNSRQVGNGTVPVAPVEQTPTETPSIPTSQSMSVDDCPLCNDDLHPSSIMGYFSDCQCQDDVRTRFHLGCLLKCIKSTHAWRCPYCCHGPQMLEHDCRIMVWNHGEGSAVATSQTVEMDQDFVCVDSLAMQYGISIDQDAQPSTVNNDDDILQVTNNGNDELTSNTVRLEEDDESDSTDEMIANIRGIYNNRRRTNPTQHRNELSEQDADNAENAGSDAVSSSSSESSTMIRVRAALTRSNSQQNNRRTEQLQDPDRQQENQSPATNRQSERIAATTTNDERKNKDISETDDDSDDISSSSDSGPGTTREVDTVTTREGMIVSIDRVAQLNDPVIGSYEDQYNPPNGLQEEQVNEETTETSPTRPWTRVSENDRELVEWLWSTEIRDNDASVLWRVNGVPPLTSSDARQAMTHGVSVHEIRFHSWASLNYGVWVRGDVYGLWARILYYNQRERAVPSRERVHYMDHQAFNMLVNNRRNRENDLDEAWTNSPNELDPFGYKFRPTLARDPDAGLTSRSSRQNNRQRLELFEDCRFVVFVINHRSLHWFAVTVDMQSLRVVVRDWRCRQGIQGRHRYAGRVILNWLVDEIVLQEHGAKLESNQRRNLRYEYIRGNRRFNNIALSQPTFACRFYQQDGHTCGVRVLALMYLLTTGVSDQDILDFNRTFGQHDRQIRVWIALCILRDDLVGQSSV